MTSAAIKAANGHTRRLIAARILLDQWALFAAFVAFVRDDGARELNGYDVPACFAAAMAGRKRR